MTQQIFTVFLSSTEEDLTAYRAAVRSLVGRNAFFKCVAMEDFGPQNSSAIPVCRDAVFSADFFVGIVGLRRGWEPMREPDYRSITEMEFEWAAASSKPMFICVSPESFPLGGHLREADEKYARQMAFRSRLKEVRVVGLRSFSTPAELAGEIISTLLTYLIAENLVGKSETRTSASGEGNAITGVAQALAQLAKDKEIDLSKLANNPSSIEVGKLEARLEERARQFEEIGQRYLELGTLNQKLSMDALSRSASYWSNIGALAFLHNTERALQAYGRAVELDVEQADSWRQLGWLQYRTGDRKTAETTFRHLLELGTQSGSRSTQIAAYHALGSIYRSRGDLADAQAMYLNALERSQSLGLKDGEADAYYGLGMIYRTRNELNDAETTQRKALKLSGELGRKERSADIYHSLGRIEQTRRNFDAAEHLFQKSITLSEEVNYQVGIGNALLSLGSVLIERAEPERGESKLRAALAINKHLMRKDGIARVLHHLGLVYRLRGELVNAKKKQESALELFLDIDRKEGIASTHSQLGDICAELGDEISALEHWHRACALYRDMNLPLEVNQIEKRIGSMPE